jgi:hypothetical protein
MSSKLNFPNTLASSSSVQPRTSTESITLEHFDGTYTLAGLGITLKNGTTVELNTVLVEMEIFEDMFKYAIEGRIRLGDFVGGQEKFVITGGERISMKVTKPNGMNEILVGRNDLIVTKISNVEFDQQNTRIYDIFFKSEASIRAYKKRIFRSFGNERNLSNIVGKLYNEIGIYGITLQNDNIALDKTFVSPGYMPLDAINHLAKRACVNGDYYVFFERFCVNPTENMSHVFCSVNSLRKFWTDNNSVPKIIFEPNFKNVDYVGTSDSQLIVRATKLRIEPNFDHVNNMRVGFYNSRIRKINLLERRYTDNKINYLNDRVNDIYSNKFINRNNIFSTYDESEITGQRLIIDPINDSIKKKDSWIKSDTLGGVLNTGIRVTAEISGGSNKIAVGNLVDLSLISGLSKAINSQLPVNHEDQLYSGTYMVTAARHYFTQKTYTKTIELSRGSMKFNIDSLIDRYKVN